MAEARDLTDVVRVGLTKTTEAEAIMEVMQRGRTDITVADRGSYWLIEGHREITIDAEDVADELGHDLTVEQVLVSFASYAGRAEIDGTLLRVTSEFLQLDAPALDRDV
jgi:hypothetical protein